MTYMKRILSVLTISLLICFFTCIPSQESLIHASQEQTMGASAEETHHKGRYWYFVDDVDYTTKDEERSVLLWLALPSDRQGQVVKVTDIYPEPTEIITDLPTGNKVAFWKIDHPEKGANLVFHYDLDVINSPVINNIDALKIRKNPEALKELSRWTISEPWIEITPVVAAKAREIVGREDNPCNQAKLVFDWIVENIDYEYPSIEDRGVLKSFERLKGDCGEFSRIFIAMMRSLGVPARSVTANWYKGSGHAWAEMYLAPYGWIPVDTSVAQLVKNGLKGQMSEGKIKEFMDMCGLETRDPMFLFGNLYPNRLEVFTGDNVKFSSPKTGVVRTFQFMQPGAMTAWPQAIELNGLSEKTIHAGLYIFNAGYQDEKAARESALEDMAPQYMKAEMYDKAITVLEKVVNKNPEKATAFFLLGQSYFQTDFYEKAIVNFQKALAGEGGSTKPVIDAWSRIFLGMSYDALKMREKALQEYSKVIESGVDHKGSLDMARKFIKEPYKK